MTNEDVVVQLRHAPLPVPLRAIAYHYWFAVLEPETHVWQRWEVWQAKNAGGTSWGHVHRDLMSVDSGVGGGPAVVKREWRGEPAARIVAVLESPNSYPFRDRYRAFPGPNSNTYVAWVLARAGVADARLNWRAVGKHWGKQSKRPEG